MSTIIYVFSFLILMCFAASFYAKRQAKSDLVAVAFGVLGVIIGSFF